jgi:hypothetical protein
MSQSVPNLTLNNGVKIPIFGLGTWNVITITLNKILSSIKSHKFLINFQTIAIKTFANFKWTYNNSWKIIS